MGRRRNNKVISPSDLKPPSFSFPKKYIVVPGFVISKSDGDHHYIDATTLIYLYKVKAQECIIISDESALLARDCTGMKILRPRYDGNYRLG